MHQGTRNTNLGIFRTRNQLMVVLIGSFWMGCTSDSAPDCLQKAGKLVTDIVELPQFDKITVFEHVRLVLKQGPDTKVEVHTGEFLRNEVSVTVDNGRLLLRDTNDCNYFRPYGTTTVFVTAPDLVEIRSSSGMPIQSDGVLAYPNLTLVSESFIDPESETTDGEFDLDIASENVQVLVNGIAFFKLRGTVANLALTVAAGDSRIETQALFADAITLNHRGSNDMLVNPRNSISGVIRGTGDVISHNKPPLIEVDEIFNGRLLFVDP